MPGEPQTGTVTGSAPREQGGDPGGRGGISRRAFVAGSVAAGAGAAALGYSGLVIARDDLRPEWDRSSPTGELEPREMATILALAEVLVPDRLRSRPARVRQIVNEATRTQPGVLQEYRGGAMLMEELAHSAAGSAFPDLSVADREGLLAGILWRYPADTGDSLDDLVTKAKRRLERAWHDGERRRFRQLVVRDLLARLYEDAVPALIGYSNLPGVPGDPRAYAGPPSG